MNKIKFTLIATLFAVTACSDPIANDAIEIDYPMILKHDTIFMLTDSGWRAVPVHPIIKEVSINFKPIN